jgi:hypothetical protein
MDDSFMRPSSTSYAEIRIIFGPIMFFYLASNRIALHAPSTYSPKV